jgi:hypothetical protein
MGQFHARRGANPLVAPIARHEGMDVYAVVPLATPVDGGSPTQDRSGSQFLGMKSVPVEPITV